MFGFFAETLRPRLLIVLVLLISGTGFSVFPFVDEGISYETIALTVKKGLEEERLLTS